MGVQKGPVAASRRGNTGPLAPSLSGSRVTVIDDTAHNAFGGVAKMANGNLIAVYRVGTSHTSLDGRIVRRVSTDSGATWGTAATVYDPTDDARDCGVAVLADGTVIVSFFRYTGTQGGYTSYTIRSTDNGSTWDTPVTVSAGFGAQTIVTAPVVQLANGNLILPCYGADLASDTVGYTTVARSTDGGSTWAYLATVAKDATKTTEYVEPNVVLLGDGSLLCMIRSDTGSFQIYQSKSTDSGATWSTASVAFGSASGRPAVHRHPRGFVMCMYRAQTPDATPGRTLYRTSWDGGASWSSASVLLSVGGSYVYGQFVTLVDALLDGNVGAFWANEVSSTNADGYWQRFADDARAA